MNPLLIHEVVIYNDDWHKAEAWCEQNIGKFNITWYKLGIDPLEMMMRPTGAETKTVWYFLREQDATMFKLKWT